MRCVSHRMTTMSKLKRKKLSVEENRIEVQSRNKKSNDSPCAGQDSSCNKTSTTREKWWESSDLSEEERLWALTLTALCPNLQSDQEESIPQLPPPSSMKTPLSKVSEWRWSSADVNPPPDLPAPSFLTQPPSDIKNPSQPPAEKMDESDPPALADQENPASSPDQGSVSSCDVQTALQRHLDDKVNCAESRQLFPQVGNGFKTKRSGVGLEAESRAEESGAGKRVKTGAGQSRSGIQTIAGASGSGSGQKAKSQEKGLWTTSGLQLGTKLRAGQKAKSQVRESGFFPGGTSEAKSGLGETGSGIATDLGGSGSGEGQGANLGQGHFESIPEPTPGTSGSGIGLGTKSEAGQRTKSKLEESGSGGLGKDLGASGSGLGMGIKSGLGGSGSEMGKKSTAEESGVAPGSGLECCPMCLMPFSAGFTQMECDGHLAQCLSEMHDDIIW